MVTKNLVGKGCRTGPPGFMAGGIGSLESIPGLLKSLKIRGCRLYGVRVKVTLQSACISRLRLVQKCNGATAMGKVKLK
jgi:hypothetical protein